MFCTWLCAESASDWAAAWAFVDDGDPINLNRQAGDSAKGRILVVVCATKGKESWVRTWSQTNNYVRLNSVWELPCEAASGRR